MPPYATTDELAARYRVTVETIRTWARQGKIPSLRVGRRPLLFDVSEVDRRLRAHRVGPGNADASAANETKQATREKPEPSGD